MSAQRKVAVVTGGSHGIGREICMKLAEDGFAVRSMGLGQKNIEESMQEARERKLDVHVYEGDVTSSADVQSFYDRVVSNGGEVRVLCNNAAIRPTGTVLTTAETDWERTFAVNLTGVFRVTKTFLPSIIAAGGGSVVNISSCSAMGSPNLIAYSSAKCGLIAFTRCLAEDHKKERVRANVILPGPTDSGMMRPIPEEVVKWCAENGVQGRLALPRDIAAAVAFLASDEAGTITGTELRVNYWPSLFA